MAEDAHRGIRHHVETDVLEVPRVRQKKIGDPRGGWVGQRPKKDRSRFFHFFLYRVFELPLLRSTRKRDKTKKTSRKKLASIFLSIALEKVFDMDMEFLQKYVSGVWCF
jgi:hypothetical protein